MTDEQWKELGYKWHATAANRSDGVWQRRVFESKSGNASDSHGFMSVYTYVHVGERIGYMFEADLDMSDGPFGIRRMAWNPTHGTVAPDLVRAIEEEYRRMAT